MAEEQVGQTSKILYHSPTVSLNEYDDSFRKQRIATRLIRSLGEVSADAGDSLKVVLLDETLSTDDGLAELEKYPSSNRPIAALLISPPGEEVEPDSPLSAVTSGVLQPPFSRGSFLLALRGAFQHATARLLAQRERNQRQMLTQNLDDLTQIGIALSAEQNHHRLLDLILTKSRGLTKSDAGSLYLVEENEKGERKLRFKHTQNDSKHIPFQEFVMPATKASIAGYVAVTGETLNLEDVYHTPGNVEFSFNKSFDESVGYRSKSMLVVPMRDHNNEITGVLQLINAKRSSEIILSEPDIAEKEVVRFEPAIEDLINSLASQAVVALENSMLVESLERTFEGFVTASVHAIEQRDPITSGHSERVTALTCALAQAVDETKEGRYADVSFSEEQMRELRYAGLLHDFGKIGVREQILQKQNKLYPLQMGVVKERFNFIKRTLESEYQEKMLQYALSGKNEEVEKVRGEMEKALAEVDEHLALIIKSNAPSMMPDGDFDALDNLSTKIYLDFEDKVNTYLYPEELDSLKIRRGNLNLGERKEIESHASHSYNFLTQIPWTKVLRGIPEIAHGHHEKLNGAGYPQGLKEEEIVLQSKMMCVCDIFDALTASDRPYKKAAPLEKAIQILGFEVKDNHLDAELMDIFVKKKVYQAVEAFHGKEYVEPEPQSKS